MSAVAPDVTRSDSAALADYSAHLAMSLPQTTVGNTWDFDGKPATITWGDRRDQVFNPLTHTLRYGSQVAILRKYKPLVPLTVMAEFGPGEWLCNSKPKKSDHCAKRDHIKKTHVIEIDVELDKDRLAAGATFDRTLAEVDAHFDGHERLIWTTISHSPGNRRYHVELLPSRGITPEEQPIIGRWLLRTFSALPMDDTQFETARRFHLPCTPKDAGLPYECSHMPGLLVDVDAVLAEQRRHEQGNGKGNGKDRSAPTGESGSTSSPQCEHGIISYAGPAPQCCKKAFVMWFNRPGHLSEILIARGWTKKSNRVYQYPGSSAPAGTKLNFDGAYETAIEYDSESPLYRKPEDKPDGTTKHPLSHAFDAYRILEHDGNKEAAFAAAGYIGRGGIEDDPLPLPTAGLTTPHPFPFHALGPIAGSAAQAIYDQVRCPDAIAGSSVLSTISLVAQALVDIERPDKRRHPVSSAHLPISGSGAGKSFADQVCTAPLVAFMKEGEAAHRRSLRQYKVLASRHKGKVKSLHDAEGMADEDLIKNLDELGEEPSRPVSNKRLCATSTTAQGMLTQLAYATPTCGLMSDEGGTFFGGYAMKADNLLATLATLTRLLDGDPVSRKLVADEDVVDLPGRRFSLHLMVQPVVAGKLFGDITVREQGFLNRCLVTEPASLVGTRSYSVRDLSKDPPVAVFHARLTELLEKTLPCMLPGYDGAVPGLTPRPLPLAADAVPILVESFDVVEKLQAPGQPYAAWTGRASRAADHALRFAGQLAVFDDPDATEIDKLHIGRGIVLASWYLAEGVRVLQAYSVGRETAEAHELYLWALAQPKGFYLRQLQRLGPSSMRGVKKHLMASIKQLLDHGLLKPLPGGTVLDGRPRRQAWIAVAVKEDSLTLNFTLVRSSRISLGGIISTEVFRGRRFETSGWQALASSQITNKVFFRVVFRNEKAIRYDADPYQGYGKRGSASLIYQPSEKLNWELNLTYADFFRETGSEKIYDYTIVRNRLTYQVNKYLFFRGIVEYNAYRQELLTDLLASFTYIPGTVVHLGYGSIYERVRWEEGAYVRARDFLETRRGFFFKASYLWRL